MKHIIVCCLIGVIGGCCGFSPLYFGEIISLKTTLVVGPLIGLLLSFVVSCLHKYHEWRAKKRLEIFGKIYKQKVKEDRAIVYGSKDVPLDDYPTKKFDRLWKSLTPQQKLNLNLAEFGVA